ncbi:MAG TPA: hypothetical protein VMA71_07280 [Alloacidobacterium sp.]|nr:hypothetical protein [Alloacidobacterium sp.]
MKRLILIIAIVALGSRSGICQSGKQNEPPATCKSGNLLTQSDPHTVQVMGHFLSEFKSAIKSGDAMRVAKLSHYPLSVATPKVTFSVATEQEFAAKYNEIFPVKLRAFLLKQQPQCISRVGAQGFTLGAGQIWFDRYPDGVVRIFSVNAIVYRGE